MKDDFFENNKLSDEKIIATAQLGYTSVYAIIAFFGMVTIFSLFIHIYIAMYFIATGILFSVLEYFRVKATKLYVTNRRILAKQGIIKIVTLESPIKKITSVAYQKDIIGIQSIIINVYGARYVFQNVINAEEIKRAIMDLQNKEE